MSALTTKKIPKNSGHLSRARVKNIGASWSAADFKIKDGIESGPVALCMFWFFSSFVTPLQLSDIVWYGLFPLFGKLFRFSFVKNGLELPH
jgi:hypothetical protein